MGYFCFCILLNERLWLHYYFNDHFFNSQVWKWLNHCLSQGWLNLQRRVNWYFKQMQDQLNGFYQYISWEDFCPASLYSSSTFVLFLLLVLQRMTNNSTITDVKKTIMSYLIFSSFFYKFCSNPLLICFEKSYEMLCWREYSNSFNLTVIFRENSLFESIFFSMLFTKFYESCSSI